MALGDFTGRGARHWANREAVVDVAKGAAGRFSYAQLDSRARALSAFLSAQGVGKGDRVGFLAHNGIELFDAFFAAARLGAVFVPYNWRLHAQELTGLLNLTRPRLLLYSPEFAQSAQAAAAASHAPPLLLDTESHLYTELLESRAPAPLADESVQPEDPLCLLFTGGTTGTPKAARISYRMVAWNTLTLLTHEARHGDTTITHTPMFHTGGLLVYTIPLLTVGGRVLVLKRWSASETLELIGKERADFFFAVPSQYEEMRQQPNWKSADLSSLRFMTSGGAPLPVPLIEAWQQQHRVPFKQGFGMTEFGPGVFSMGPEFAIAKAGSIGRPNCWVEARLYDHDGRDVSKGEVGELHLKGQACFSGYHEMAEESARAFDSNGYFRTGDLAKQDDDGFFFIVGRKKDMYISGGENIYPVEIEQLLYQHPSVAACAVVGIPDARWGEVGHAFIVLRAGKSASGDELLERLRGQLAKFKVPKAITFVESLPMTPAGKVRKHELRASLLENPT